jgi:hypothetical protein
MTDRNSLLVRHGLVALQPDEYPHWQGQSWADPDVDHAWSLLRPVLDDPDRGRALARRGQADVLRTHGNRAVGLRILDGLERIAAAGMARRAPAPVPAPVPAPPPAPKGKSRRAGKKNK